MSGKTDTETCKQTLSKTGIMGERQKNTKTQSQTQKLTESDAQETCKQTISHIGTV